MANIGKSTWACVDPSCAYVNTEPKRIACAMCGTFRSGGAPNVQFETIVPVDIVYDDNTRIPFKAMVDGTFELIYDPKLDEKKILDLVASPMFDVAMDPKEPGRLVLSPRIAQASQKKVVEAKA